MPRTEPNPRPLRPWLRLGRSLGARLIVAMLAAIFASFALVGWLNIRLHRRQLEAATQLSAERVSDVIKRSTSYYMLRNDREGLYHIIGTMADEPGMVRIRIFNQEGRISFSTAPAEINTYVEKDAEACYGCHAAGQPLTRLDRPDRIRVYRHDGHRVMGVISPIENQPACSNAACHAHPPEQKVLGVLDTNLSLDAADADLAAATRTMAAHTVLAGLMVALLSGGLIWRMVGVPLRALKRGTERLAVGELGYQLAVTSGDEAGELAASFNQMSRQLAEARDTLETRVEQKTRELKVAHMQMLQTEKLASIGKLAAVVAHEINNPLSGVLVYTKLVGKWLDRGAEPSRVPDMRDTLRAMETEVLRCSGIVRNMLTFARAAPMNLGYSELGPIVDRCLRLVQHKLELAGIQSHRGVPADLPPLWCDAGQFEQLLLVLVINAIEAMPRGGNLWLRARRLRPTGEVEIQVQDDGAGIPPEMLPHMFEPFQTTKGSGGVGLGLAVARQIVERHNGRIEAASSPGRGATFTITLPPGPEQEKRGETPWQAKAIS